MGVTDGNVTAEIEVVERFLAALEHLDAETAIDLLHPDVTYRNVPFPAARGVDAVATQLRGLARFCSGFEAINHNVASNGSVVLTERTDVIEVGRVRMAFWVCGTFEVRDGRIVVWCDRFDMVDITRAMVWGLLRAPFSR